MYKFMKYYNWQKFVHQKYKVVLFNLHITTLKLGYFMCCHHNHSVVLHIHIADAASVVHCDAKYLVFFFTKYITFNARVTLC